MKIEVLGFSDCPNYAPALKRTRAALQNLGIQAVIEEHEIHSDVAAAQAHFLGSPTVRVNGLDVEAAARYAQHFGIGCRIYIVNGERCGLPPQRWIEDTMREAMSNGVTSA